MPFNIPNADLDGYLYPLGSDESKVEYQVNEIIRCASFCLKLLITPTLQIDIYFSQISKKNLSTRYSWKDK